MARPNYTLNLLLVLEEKTWVAHCLEYDIVAQGATIDKATQAFERTFFGQILVDIHHGKTPLEGVGRAPREVWDAFRKAKRLVERKPLYVPEEIPAMAATAEEVRISA